MLEDLQAFVRHQGWPTGFRMQTELEFAFPLRESLAIRGRIDRLDSTPDGRGFVIDYKYSSPQLLRSRLENVTLLQAQLYLIAVERCFGLRPAGVFYCGLRGQVRYAVGASRVRKSPATPYRRRGCAMPKSEPGKPRPKYAPGGFIRNPPIWRLAPTAIFAMSAVTKSPRGLRRPKMDKFRNPVSL